MKEVSIQRPSTAVKQPRPKLDLRLATLLELGPEVFGDHEDRLERFGGFRHSGPLAGLRGSLPPSGLRRGGFESFLPSLVAQVFLTRTEKGSFERVVSDIHGAPAETEELGPRLKLLSKVKTIATAEVRIDAIALLEAHADIAAIEWTGAFRPAALEESVAGELPLSPRKAIGLERCPPDLDGRGTLVGIVDLEGIDLYHPAFVDGHGRSRVRALWDQRLSSPSQGSSASGSAGLAQPPYGSVYDRDAIDYELHPEQIKRGAIVASTPMKASHGTMTASLAAGLGGDKPEACGIAPGAEIVFVNTFDSSVGALGAMTELADALAFVFAVADADDKACVVSLSLADNTGGRDGRSPVERFIDEIVDEKAGRAVVVAAGNSAGSGQHRRVQFNDAGPGLLEIEVGSPNHQRAGFEIWYSLGAEGNGALDIEIEAPDDGGGAVRIAADGLPRAFDIDGTRLLVASALGVPGDLGNAERNGHVRIELLTPERSAALRPGIWKIRLMPRGGVSHAHAWIDHRHIRFANGGNDDATTLTTPATASRAISVGACDTQRREPYFFSGRGPSRGPANKPDLAAVGGPVWVASAMTAVRYVGACGTSMASPLVAGALALAFQRHGKDLGRDQVLAKLFPEGTEWRDNGVGCGPLDLSHWDVSPAAAPEMDSAPRPEPEIHLAGDATQAVRRHDTAQIQFGRYFVLQGSLLVGYLLVTPGTGERRSVETWLLSPRYLAPSPDRRRQEITFRYIGLPARLVDFVKRYGQGGWTCIQASCLARRIDKNSSFQAYLDELVPANNQFPKVEDIIMEVSQNQSQKPLQNQSQSFTRPQNAVQIQFGRYRLVQGSTTVGALLVTEGTAEGSSVERWLLYTSYQWPSADYPDKSIEFVYLSTPVSVATFLDGAPSNATYIVANCQITALPE